MRKDRWADEHSCHKLPHDSRLSEPDEDASEESGGEVDDGEISEHVGEELPGPERLRAYAGDQRDSGSVGRWVISSR